MAKKIKSKISIDVRQEREKQLVLENLRKMPIVQVACERAGIGRATYYRWCAEDEKFEKAAQDAMAEGDLLMNDMGESQLLTLMKDKHWSAIKYWLEKHHPRYVIKKSDSTSGKNDDVRVIMLHDHED